MKFATCKKVCYTANVFSGKEGHFCRVSLVTKFFFLLARVKSIIWIIDPGIPFHFKRKIKTYSHLRQDSPLVGPSYITQKWNDHCTSLPGWYFFILLFPALGTTFTTTLEANSKLMSAALTPKTCNIIRP